MKASIMIGLYNDIDITRSSQRLIVLSSCFKHLFKYAVKELLRLGGFLCIGSDEDFRVRKGGAQTEWYRACPYKCSLDNTTQ